MLRVLCWSVLAFVVILFASTRAHAQNDLITYDGPGGLCVGTDACDALGLADVIADNPDYTGCAIDGSRYNDNAPPWHWMVRVSCLNASGNPVVKWREYQEESVPPECIPGGGAGNPPQCPDPCPVSGLSFIKSGPGTAPASFCNDNCSFTRDSGGHVQFTDGWVGSYVAGDGCVTNDADQQTGQNCISTSAGTQYCVDPNASQNCGTVNGEYVCLDNAPQGGCIFTPGGQAICDGGSQANAADETITDPVTGNTYDVYGDGGTGGQSGGGASFGTDEGTGTSAGSGPGTGEGECDGDACSGTLPGSNEAVDDFGTMFGSFYARIEAAPIIAAFDGIPGALPVGTCSAIDSDAIAFFEGQVLTIDAHCTLWDEVAPIISGVMLAVWALLGGLIILRA